ncbi:MAG TPA: signal peptidase I [Firmicutes bacterium]|nr:signal peptidase I [Bacillota bacterium]HBX25053.1 signal peptidase I [Bacillota bacterium]
MPDNYLENQVNGEPKPLKKKTKWWVVAIDIFFLLVFLLVIAVSSNVIYLTSAYGEPFFVSGASMYPTLNSEGFKYIKEKDEYRPLTWNDIDNDDGDIVDYGWAKSKDKDNWRSDLHRYDIVITYYPKDYIDYSSNQLKSNASLKIKRLIGFPGETVKFERDDAFNPVWGKTTIIKPDGQEEVLPNLYDVEDFPDLPNGTKYLSRGITGARTLSLGEDEYFVMGDNRVGSHSEDSRTVGALKGNMLQGKAYVITGMRKLSVTIDGQGNKVKEPKLLLDKIRMPWNYKKLEYKI